MAPQCECIDSSQALDRYAALCAVTKLECSIRRLECSGAQKSLARLHAECHHVFRESRRPLSLCPCPRLQASVVRRLLGLHPPRHRCCPHTAGSERVQQPAASAGYSCMRRLDVSCGPSHSTEHEFFLLEIQLTRSTKTHEHKTLTAHKLDNTLMVHISHRNSPVRYRP